MNSNYRLGDDGYPVPEKPNNGTFKCSCPICMDGGANLSISKKNNWIVRCPTCSIILYLNSITSINLFRGLQRFIDVDPEHQVKHTAGIVRYAPDIGK
jgi:hypothetical protein